MGLLRKRGEIFLSSFALGGHLPFLPPSSYAPGLSVQSDAVKQHRTTRTRCRQVTQCRRPSVRRAGICNNQPSNCGLRAVDGPVHRPLQHSVTSHRVCQTDKLTTVRCHPSFRIAAAASERR